MKYIYDNVSEHSFILLLPFYPATYSETFYETVPILMYHNISFYTIPQHLPHHYLNVVPIHYRYIVGLESVTEIRFTDNMFP